MKAASFVPESYKMVRSSILATQLAAGWAGYFASVSRYPRDAWLTAIACLAAIGVSPPVLATAITFLVDPIAAESGSPKATILAIFAASMLIGPIALPFIGTLLDRYGARAVALPAMAIYGLAILLVAFAGTDLPLLSGALLIAAIAGFSASLGVAYKVIAEWFIDHQGAGFSLFLGISVGFFSAVFAPIFSFLVVEIGWRAMYLSIGLVILGVSLPIQWFFLRDAPKVSDRRCEVVTGPCEPISTRATSTLTAISSRPWWLTAVILSLVGGAIMSIRICATSLLLPRGFSVQDIAFILSTLLAGSIIGQVIAGFCLDRIASPRVALPFMLCALAGVLLFANGGDSGLMIGISAFLMGIATGAEGSIGPYFIVRYFGLAAIGRVNGAMLASVGAAMSLTPIVFGSIVAQPNQIPFALVCLQIAAALSAALVFCLPPYRVSKMI